MFSFQMTLACLCLCGCGSNVASWPYKYKGTHGASMGVLGLGLVDMRDCVGIKTSTILFIGVYDEMISEEG